MGTTSGPTVDPRAPDDDDGRHSATDDPRGLMADVGDSGGGAGSDDAASHFDGRRRRKQAGLVVGVALLAGAGGMVVGGRVRSPADEAAARSAPIASRITVPVVSQRLESTLTLSGEIQYSDPYSIRLGGVVGSAADDAQVVTRVPDVDQEIAEGAAVFEVSGRPVIFLQGDLPMYRQLAIGSQGPDVAELEIALDRLGYDAGTVDDVFDAATAYAVAAMYGEAGYQSEGPTPDQSEALRLARESVTTAAQSVRDANTALTDGSAGPTGSELLSLQQALAAAKAAVPIAQQTSAADNATAQGAVTTATVDRDAARTVRDEAVRMRDDAAAVGAIDPDTGEAYTSTRRSELATEAAVADQQLATAEVALTAAVNAVPTVAANGTTSSTAATDAVALAQLQLDEATKPADTTTLKASVTAAEQVVTQADLDLVDAENAAGLRVSPGELMFVPVLPSAVTSVDAVLGSAATEQLATISTSDTSVRASVSRVDADLVQVGDPVTIEVREVGVEVAGTVVSIGAPAAEANSEQGSADGGDSSGGDSDANSSGGTTGRLEIVVLPDDLSAVREYIGSSAKIQVAVASTDSDVLVVPVAALTVGPDGGSRVEVELAPISADSDGETTIVPVEVGLSANGLVEVRGAPLAIGDRVVIGSDNPAAPSSDATADDATDSSSGDAESGDENTD